MPSHRNVSGKGKCECKSQYSPYILEITGLNLSWMMTYLDLIIMFTSYPVSLIEICTLLGFYATWSGNSVPVFWDNLLVPSSGVKQSQKNFRDSYIGNGEWYLALGVMPAIRVDTAREWREEV
jgi:hypothetical protein